MRIARERVRASKGEKGVHICMSSRSLSAVRTDNSRVLFLRSSTGGIEIQHGKWKRISLVPPVVPMTARATNFSSTFTPSFSGLQVLAFLTLSLPHCFLLPHLPHRRVAPLLPNNTLFPLATSTSESLLRSLNTLATKLLIKRIYTTKINFFVYIKRLYMVIISRIIYR